MESSSPTDGLLRPILVTGLGRSGSTALIALLGTDPRTVMDRAYPYENCYLTYFTKLALLQQRLASPEAWNTARLIDFADSACGGYPYRPTIDDASRDGILVPEPSACDWLVSLWTMLSRKARLSNPQAQFYAEKAPTWLPAYVREAMPCFTLHLWRDPRDIFLSANSFMKKRQYFSFGRSANDTDQEFARTLAYNYACHLESFISDRERNDGLAVRYEDLVRKPEDTVERINDVTGLHATARIDCTHFDSHGTTATPDDSIGRWRREPISHDILAFFDATLGEALTILGYEQAGAPESCSRPFVDFRRAAASALEHSTHGDLQRATGDGTPITISGEDFWLILPVGPFAAKEVREVWVALCGDTGNHCSLYWQQRDSGFCEAQSIHLPFQPSRHTQVVRFQPSLHDCWQGEIAQLRLDLFNGPIAPGPYTARLSWVRLVA
jgi:hypothetical protein